MLLCLPHSTAWDPCPVRSSMIALSLSSDRQPPQPTLLDSSRRTGMSSDWAQTSSVVLLASFQDSFPLCRYIDLYYCPARACSFFRERYTHPRAHSTCNTITDLERMTSVWSIAANLSTDFRLYSLLNPKTFMGSATESPTSKATSKVTPTPIAAPKPLRAPASFQPYLSKRAKKRARRREREESNAEYRLYAARRKVN